MEFRTKTKEERSMNEYGILFYVKRKGSYIGPNLYSIKL